LSVISYQCAGFGDQCAGFGDQESGMRKRSKFKVPNFRFHFHIFTLAYFQIIKLVWFLVPCSLITVDW
jgi:hypothetical protein